jgi:shikimate dehydrogenase
MKKYGLIGYPLGHSFSKKYFSEKFLKENITGCSYDNYPLKTIDELPGLIRTENALCGLNVTIPYKSEVLKFLDDIENEAAMIGAVNVIKIRRTGEKIRLSGFNSDIKGIKDTLCPFIGENVRNALILGSGGSSKAVCHVLRNLGLEVSLVSREDKPGCMRYADITQEVLAKNLLIVNTTPLGMFPNIETKPDIDYKRLTPSHILFDLVYNPQLTAFMKMGEKHGCTVLSGLKMLHSQAERAWEIWNDSTL